MTNVFLSYSHKDHHFAELITIKLAEAGIIVWRDQGTLRAGSDWRQGIEPGIAESIAVIVALSANSAESSYVTFEWAYALGNGRNLIPIKLNECPIHPRIQSIQHLDFPVPGALPWASLVERINEIAADAQQEDEFHSNPLAGEPPPADAVYVQAIIAYLDQRGYQAISFESVRKRIDATLTDQKLNELILDNPGVFRHAKLRNAKPGLAKLRPWTGAEGWGHNMVMGPTGVRTPHPDSVGRSTTKRVLRAQGSYQMSDTSIVNAKARLPGLVQRAEAGEPVHITRRGKRVAVILSERDWPCQGGAPRGRRCP